jgi:Rrf2 family nitric oxide-sensitive transcriptional repressor
MRLTQRTDLALRALILLAVPTDEPGQAQLSVPAMAQTLDVSLHHLQKAVGALRKAGFVASQRGSAGGNRLALPPTQVSVGAVVRALEPVGMVACERDEPCVFTRGCRLTVAIAAATSAFLDTLDAVPLTELTPREVTRLIELAPRRDVS